ncbi:23S rRNA methyltransferase [Solibacillus sp. MA9]|uniref:23S rRNA methyltransferase n=1 Tax=Solibacillus palustris TaxID=2908203 RepID=A0ABS9UBE7_9BACL|nr:23S rRNA methyltransferase [Solibacillus sp. MA9]MCH7321667.1 23S rRNA methyltransferase [Solibacillus sp. MA9]
MRKLIPLLLAVILLIGCSNTMEDIKNAASGINSKANEAATAISIDVHTIRAIELEFEDEYVTINDLFKTILRDVQWHYDESMNTLKITGTWKDNQLFSEQGFTEQQKQDLVENGKVTIQLNFVDNNLTKNDTTAQMTLHNKLLVDQQGEQLLQHFYDVFKN